MWNYFHGAILTTQFFCCCLDNQKDQNQNHSQYIIIQEHIRKLALMLLMNCDTAEASARK